MFLELIGLALVVYILGYVICLAFSDCSVNLLWSEYYGKPIGVLKNKVIWITGASSGIGEFLAVELAKHGAKLVISARSAVNLERVKGRCIDEGLAVDNILVLPFDVLDYSKHEECLNRVVTHFGKLDVLVCNAGRSQRCAWEDIELEVDKEMFELNVFSVVNHARHVLKYFKKNNYNGHIAVTSSVTGVFGAPFSASYTGSKFAIHGYFNALRTEYVNTNLAVTLLCPGPVFSNMLQQCFTGKAGEKLGTPMQPTDKRMQTSRCAYLFALAIANKLDEVWVGNFPIVPLVYTMVYHPMVAKWLGKMLGSRGIMKLRDSRQTVKND